MALHDWIDIPPLTNIEELKKHHTVKERLIGSIINTSFVLIALMLTVLYASTTYPLWVAITLVTIYLLLTIGTICAWWIPYVFGSSQAHKKGFAEYRNTHHFLPERGDNVIPNTLHVLLHLLVWTSFACSIFILAQAIS